MPSTTFRGRNLGGLALAVLAVPLAAACWSDVNEAQHATDTVTAFDSLTPAQPAEGASDQGAGPPGPAATPVDTSAANRDTLGVPTSGGTAGGGAATPPLSPPPVE